MEKVFLMSPLTGIHGHMVTAQNEIKESLKLIDIVVEVLDARIPISSQNPLIKKLAKDKSKIIVLNKSDLADKVITSYWKKYFNDRGIVCLDVNSADSNCIKKIIQAIKEQGEKVYLEKNKEKSQKIAIKPIYRVLIAGIPNVGKSTIINKIAGKQSANVGNKPGVTRKKQWIRVADNIDLLDTPGLLWPNLDDKNAGVKLALTGNIKQEILDVEELACLGIDMLCIDDKYQKMLQEKYKLEDEDFDMISYDTLEVIGKKRGCVVSGGNIDMTKAAICFLEDLKSGKIGNISLDLPDNTI
ncbi:MAG: ribosome biogenesis GTPase YlqF [Clostridia bacterium]|nr:ribosome biogenesis GTPase YlqF [Clostridia bacterium]